MPCEACHGSTHAIFPSSETSDDVLATSLQGYAGTIAECPACHESAPLTVTGGPHGMHTVGDRWVGSHKDPADDNPGACTACHGPDYRDSPFSALKVERTFRVENRTRTFPAGHRIGCCDCHDGPDGDD